MSLQVAHNYISLHRISIILTSLGAGSIILSERYLDNNRPSLLLKRIGVYIRNMFINSSTYFNIYYHKTSEYSKNIVQKYKPGYEVIEIGLLTSLNAVILYKLYTNSDTIVGIFNKTLRNMRLK
jgi:hypothetical protein